MNKAATSYVQFPPNYIVDFTAGPTAGPTSGPIPDVDTAPGLPGNNVLGPMTFGGDGNDVDGGVVFEPGGLVVKVTSPHSIPTSRTVYVVSKPIFTPKPIPAILPGLFSEAGTLVAEVEFDSPRCVLSNGQPWGMVWAVGVNFKTGDATDVDTELRIGPTCNFGDNGRVNFNGTDYSTRPAYDGTYAEYAKNGTRFLLRAYLYRSATVVAANASLIIDGAPTEPSGNITPSPNAILQNLTDAATNPAKITAVGISVHTNPDVVPMPQLTGTVLVSARLLSFSLYYK